MVVTTSDNHPKASRKNIDERSGVAVETIKPKQHGNGGKCKLCGIAGAHLESPQQFATIIPIAWPTKRAEKLMRMCLEHDRAGTHHFSPLAPLIPWSTDCLEATVRSGQRLYLWQRPLAGSSPGPVHIDDEPGFAN